MPLRFYTQRLRRSQVGISRSSSSLPSASRLKLGRSVASSFMQRRAVLRLKARELHILLRLHLLLDDLLRLHLRLGLYRLLHGLGHRRTDGGAILHGLLIGGLNGLDRRALLCLRHRTLPLRLHACRASALLIV